MPVSQTDKSALNMSYVTQTTLLENLDLLEQKCAQQIIHLMQQLMPLVQICHRKAQNAQVCLNPYFALLSH
jgi:hypothetical protein